MYGAFNMLLLCELVVLFYFQQANMIGDDLVSTLTVVITLAITIVTFVSMIVNDLRLHNKDSYRFDTLDKSIDDAKSQRLHNHDALSSEHSDILNSLSSKHSDTLNAQRNIHRDLLAEDQKIYNSLTNFIAKEEGTKEKVSEVLPDQKRLLNDVREVYRMVAELKGKNDHLEDLLSHQEEQIRSLHEQSHRYQDKYLETESILRNMEKELSDKDKEIQSLQNHLNFPDLDHG